MKKGRSARTEKEPSPEPSFWSRDSLPLERLLARHAILSTRVEAFLITSTLEARSEERALAFFRKRVQENGSGRVSQNIWATSLEQGIKITRNPS